MSINEAGLALLKSFEGCRLMAYQDSVGVWTIGYGCTKGVTPGMVITQDEADERLREDLEDAEDGVDALLHVHTTSNEFSALVCFAYNVGLNNLKHSTLLSKLNAADYEGAADEFTRWSKAGGKEIPGLLRRREAERDLFLLS